MRNLYSKFFKASQYKALHDFVIESFLARQQVG